jgi:hypothetical protein
MIFRRPTVAGRACMAFLLAFGIAHAAPNPTPTPNPTDLSILKGRYSGVTKVAFGNDAPFIGQAKIRFTPVAMTGAILKIRGDVKTAARTTSVDNELTFYPTGEVRGKHLLPGLAKSLPFVGIYTATGRRIKFSGSLELGKKTTATFTGIVNRNSFERMQVMYSVFIEGNTTVAYTYTYIGE